MIAATIAIADTSYYIYCKQFRRYRVSNTTTIGKTSTTLYKSIVGQIREVIDNFMENKQPKILKLGVNIVTTDIYQLLSKYSVPGVFALINNADKKVYIASSNDVLSSVAKIFNQVKFNKHPLKDLVTDRHKLDLVLLDYTSEKSIQLHQVELYSKTYLNNGFTFYRKPRYSKYKWKHYINTSVKVDLYLETTYGLSHYVGTFDNIADANKYIKTTTIYKQLKQLKLD
jgi:hypothetical protein